MRLEWSDAMEKSQIETIVKNQREFFFTGATLDVSFRLDALKKLKVSIEKRSEEISAAIKFDLGKSEFESYMCEVGLTLSELSYMLKHTKKFAREKTVPTPITNFHSRSYKKPSPHGVVLIMSPWNYPFLLTLEPLVDALSAGNTAVVKPSAYSPATSDVIEKILHECFEPKYVAVVKGGRAENSALLETQFDYIFFTGSQSVGKAVLQNAAKFLTPATLELGGKSPCIVEKSANIKLAAKRIVFGKFLNCGQTCVAPDYVYCDETIKEEFLREVKKEIVRQYGNAPLENPDYGKIVNEKHFSRINSLIEKAKVVHGGASDERTLRIEPTVMDGVNFSDAIMQEEIFGPVMPILTFKSLDEAVQKINSLEHPLALYIFTSRKSLAKKVMARCGFGGGCINDVVIHLATSEMGFGGFGQSGMGAYHGEDGFRTFSHYKSIIDKKTWMDLPMRYQPYKKFFGKLLKIFLK